MCTSRLLAPAEVDDDGHLIDHISDCQAMSTFFKPAYSRTCIAFFVLIHTLALLLYTCQLALRLVEIQLNESKKDSVGSATDLEDGQSQVKRMLVIATRFLSYRGSGSGSASNASLREDTVKRQIRFQLYTISIAGKTLLIEKIRKV